MRFQILQLDETHETANVKILMHLGIYVYRTNFIRISVVPHNFHKDFSCTAQISLGFQLYRTGFYRIEVVVFARKESQPAVQAASCAGCELCGREPALPAFSTEAHPIKKRLCCAVFNDFQTQIQ